MSHKTIAAAAFYSRLRHIESLSEEMAKIRRNPNATEVDLLEARLISIEIRLNRRWAKKVQREMEAA